MTTDRDYADKSWLREKPFQLVDPQVAGALLYIGLALALIGERLGWW